MNHTELGSSSVSNCLCTLTKQRSHNRPICMISVSRNQNILVRKSRNIPIASELSSLGFITLVRVGLSFAIRYSNIVNKSLCGNRDICPNYHASAYFLSRNYACVISVADRNRKYKMLFWIAVSVALLNSLADFATKIHFSHKNDRANADIQVKNLTRGISRLYQVIYACVGQTGKNFLLETCINLFHVLLLCRL